MAQHEPSLEEDGRVDFRGNKYSQADAIALGLIAPVKEVAVETAEPQYREAEPGDAVTGGPGSARRKS
ncbi:hypothetical protein DFO58_3303 [Arthrobacter sp. AG1021]|nr:hypothetical protein DFO58_3303 [Arthrobacter sp. AG1021]